jgi:hypothetical protein
MGFSTTEGSANVAKALAADLAGQTLNINGDVSDTAQGLTLTSNNGTVYKVTITDAGLITGTAV